MSTLTPEQLSELLDDYCDRVINKTDPDTIGSITEFVDIHSPKEESNRVIKKPAPQENRPYRINCFSEDK
jgi:hypothetical protein